MIRSVAIWLRVSTEDQKLGSQQDTSSTTSGARVEGDRAFPGAGVGGAAQYRKVVDEIIDGVRSRRSEAGATFRGDRSFQTAGKGCLFIDELISICCAFVSVEDGIDTSMPATKLMAKMGILMAD